MCFAGVSARVLAGVFCIEGLTDNNTMLWRQWNNLVRPVVVVPILVTFYEWLLRANKVAH